MTDLAYLPTDADLAAEVADLDAEDARARLAAEPRDFRPTDRVALALAAASLSGEERQPDRAATAGRPRAASLMAWAEDPGATLPPLRLAADGDPGDVVRGGGFALSALARAVAPDLAALGWTATAAGGLAHHGSRASADVLAEAVSDLLRQAAQAAREGLETLTERRPFDGSRGGPTFQPVSRYAAHLARLERHVTKVADGPDDGTGRRVEAAWHALASAAAIVTRPAHDPTAARFGWPLLETVGDLMTPRTRRTLAGLVREHLPACAPASVADLATARDWLAGLSGVIPRPALADRYAAAGSPGDLDRPGLYALAAEVIGRPRKRRGSWVFVAPAASA